MPKRGRVDKVPPVLKAPGSARGEGCAKPQSRTGQSLVARAQRLIVLVAQVREAGGSPRQGLLNQVE